MLLQRDPLRNPEPLIRRVYAYVAYRIGDGPDAEDVTSETFERALRYRKNFDPAKGEPISWLIGIARRCIDDMAGRYGQAAELPEDTPGPGNLEEDVVRRLTLRAAVTSLNERDRELLALRYGADLSSRQIAEALGLKASAVDVRVHRALARLRVALEREAPGGGSEATAPGAVGNPIRSSAAL